MDRIDGFNLDDFRADPADPDTVPNRAPKRPPRHRQGEAFLKGPIPWCWLLQAAKLPGKALHVALLLWREAGCSKKRTVRFRQSSGAEFGFHADTTKRGLRALAAAGLVKIRTLPGRALEVTILDVAQGTTLTKDT